MTTTPTPTAGPSNLTAHVVSEIKAEMGRRDVTRAELARRLDVSAMWVGDRLRGETQITLSDLERIAAALGVSISVLLPPRSGGLPAGATHGEPRKPIDPLAQRVVATVGNLALRPRIGAKVRRNPSHQAVTRDRPATRIGS